MALFKKTKGMPQFQAIMDGYMDRMQNPSAFLRAGGVLMLESVQRNFMEGGRPDTWKPVSEVTYLLRYRDKARFTTHSKGPNKGRVTKASSDNFVSGGAEPLRDTGVLMASIAPKEQTEKSISIGTNQPQAALQHYGGESKGFIKGKAIIPARPFLMFQDVDRETLGRMAKEFVMGK